MLVKDEAKQAAHAKQAAQEAYTEAVAAETYRELERGRIMEDTDLAPNNPARQSGRIKTPRELEALIRRFGIPDLLFEVHPTNPNKRCLFQVRRGEKHLICVYENNPMPEFSIINAVDKWIPDPDYLGGSRVVQRRDMEGLQPVVTEAEAAVLLEKYGFAGALAELQKRQFEIPPSHIGMKKVRVPGGEAVRGWRTVLVYIMNHGLVSPEQVRNVIDGADRASWAGHMGRGEAFGEWLK